MSNILSNLGYSSVPSAIGNNTSIPTATLPIPTDQTSQPNTGLDPQVVNLAKAIRQTESNGNFQAQGKSGEYGAYQWTAGTWAADSQKYLGQSIPITDATPEQQNEVAYKKIADWKAAGYNVGQIASMWNAGGGKPNAYLTGNSGVNSYGVKYDTSAYAKKVATAYQQFKSQSGNTPGIGSLPQNNIVPPATQLQKHRIIPRLDQEVANFFGLLLLLVLELCKPLPMSPRRFIRPQLTLPLGGYYFQIPYSF